VYVAWPCFHKTKIDLKLLILLQTTEPSYKPKFKIMEEIANFKSETLITREISNMKSLYDTYSGMLLGVIALLVENEQIREEMLHKTFIRIMLEREKYDPLKSTFFTWMMNITIEVTAEYLRVQLIDLQKKFCKEYKAILNSN
jgi:hypothetical protein